MTGEHELGRVISPQQFSEIARALTPQVAELWGSGEYVPPFDVMFTDADKHLVMGIEMSEDGSFRSLPDAPYVLRATFPLEVTLVDRHGKTWKRFLGESDLPSL